MMNRLKLKAGWAILLLVLFFFRAPAARAAAYSGGDGSEASPYQIANAADLITLSRTSGDWAKHFIQTADIEFDANEALVDWDADGNPDGIDTSGFTPIGNGSSNFTGSYDGDGHTISNLFIDIDGTSSSAYVGLFGYVNTSGELKSIALINVDISSSSSSANSYAGGLAGYIRGNITNSYATGSVFSSSSYNSYAGGLAGSIHGDIINGYATGSVSSFSSSSYRSRAGGLAGYAAGDITNSYATGSIFSSSYSSYAGGLIGEGASADIKNSYASGSVSAFASYNSYAGGLAGYIRGNITNSYATGSVSSSSSSYNSYAGGLAGSIHGDIINGYATGSVSSFSSSSYRSRAGGLAGYATGDITNSYATGSIFSSSYSSYAGGLIGEGASADIKNSYASGSVSAFASYNSYAGGLAGYIRGNITNSYATGRVFSLSSSAASYAGGLAGITYFCKMKNSFYDTQTTKMNSLGTQGNETTISNSQGLTTDQFKSSHPDFTTYFTWNIKDSPDDDAPWVAQLDNYPELYFSLSTSAPGVSTVAATDIDTTTATAIGLITDLGDPDPTSYGFCWSTSTAPTIDSCDGISKTQETVTATGSFSSGITGLTENTTYYIRAFATNDAGTGYGNSISFTTLTTDSGNSGDTDDLDVDPEPDDDPEPDEQLADAIDDALNAIEQSGNVVESAMEALDLAVGLIASGEVDPDDTLDVLTLAARVLAYLDTLAETDAATVLAILANANEIATAALSAHEAGQTLTSYELTLILRQSTAVIESLGALVQTLDFDDRLDILDQAGTLLVSGITAGLAASDMDTDTLSSLVDTISDLMTACMSGTDAKGCAQLIDMAKDTILGAVEAALAADGGSGAGRDLAGEIANEVRLICDAVYDFLTEEASAGSAALSRNQALAAGSVAAMDSEETDENLTLSDIRDLTGDIAEMLSPFTENDLTLSNRLVRSVVALLDELYEAGIDPLAETLGIDTSQGAIAGDQAALISALADAPGLLGQLLDAFAATIACSIDRQDLVQALEAVYTAELAAALEGALPALVDFNQVLLTLDSQTVIDTVTRALGLYYPDDVVSVTGDLDTSLAISLAGGDGSTLGEIQTVMVSDVRLVPSVIPDGVYILGDDDRRLLVSAPLAVTIAPVFSHTCDAMLALLDDDYPVALETDGRFTIAFDEATTLCAMTGYGLSQVSDEDGSGILFKAQVDDPASATYKIAINYADSTTQDMVPAVLDLDILKNYLNSLNVTFSIDRDSGIFTLGDGCTYRPGFWITALTEDDLSYFNEHQVSGAAFRLAGNNIQFISATGKQVFYFLEE